jgi:hypothetical protein
MRRSQQGLSSVVAPRTNALAGLRRSRAIVGALSTTRAKPASARPATSLGFRRQRDAAAAHRPEGLFARRAKLARCAPVCPRAEQLFNRSSHKRPQRLLLGATAPKKLLLGLACAGRRLVPRTPASQAKETARSRVCGCLARFSTVTKRWCLFGDNVTNHRPTISTHSAALRKRRAS